MSDEFSSVPSDTSKVDSIGGNRRCSKCGMGKQWRNREWVCLNCNNAIPQDWKHPLSHTGLTVKGGLDEKDKVEIVQETSTQVAISTQVPKVSKQEVVETKQMELIEVPQQAREVFQKLAWNVLRVSLDQAQAENLLHELEEMPTPQKMSDAKAIIGLVNQLESYIKQGETK